MSSPCEPGKKCEKTLGGTKGYECSSEYDFCEQMKPCNNNSRCVYSKEKKTFHCKCLSAECEALERNGSIVSLKDDLPRVPFVNTSSDKGRTSSEDPKDNEFKFNTDNVSKE